MICREPDISDTSRYSIGEAADILGIHRSTLLRHTKLGYVGCKRRGSGNRKSYTGRDLKRYWRDFK